MADAALQRPRITDERAWTKTTIDSQNAWYYPLPENCVKLIDDAIQDLRKNPRPIGEIKVSDEARKILREGLKPTIVALEEGRGFAVITGIDPGQYSDQEQQAAYWLVGHGLGIPFEQNVQGTILYDVRDTGYKVEQGVRFSVTNAESTFHTDNSFGDTVLDYVGLLCLKTAKSGGLSQNVSGYAAYNELLDHHPEELDALCQPFHVDRRGGVKEGQDPTAQIPVFYWDGPELLIRYLRFWIHEGHRKIEKPLTPEQIRALDTLDSLLARPDLRAEFALKPGEMFFINNRWILHNRTAFEDYPEPERKRHLIRLWLRRDQ